MTDHITQNLSTELYKYMCQSIVGTDDHVKQIRLLHAVRDRLYVSDKILFITSGSFGEGFDMRGSDFDIMFVRLNIEVYDVKPHFMSHMSYLSIDTDEVRPGFALLKLEFDISQILFDNCVQYATKHYLSSTLWKQRHMVDDEMFNLHGPCFSDKNNIIDVAVCLHCKSWVLPAKHWISRSNNAWPSYNVKQNIIKHGVLLVPIGVKGSSNEDIEWRISFSIGEKLLINTFTHTQLCCYGLLKIFLKDVIATDAECKELLCSYFLKTIIFWISEELPQSAWKPDKLIACFMQCFSRLIYCVDYSVCLHYFIPENNMFENKIEGSSRKILLEKLYTLHSYGWRCILLSDQLSNFPASMRYFNMEQHRSHLYKVEKNTKSYLFRFVHTFFRLSLDWNSVKFTSLIKRVIQKSVSFDQSLIKYLYTYYMSMICSIRAQSIPLNTAYSNNKYQYRQYKSRMCILLQNIYHDAVSGWLMIASFFYNTREHMKALHIVHYSLSKCTFDKLYDSMEFSDIHHQSFILKSLQKKSVVHLRKLMFIDGMFFKKKSMLVPQELLSEVKHLPFFISSSVYGHFLNFLCHYHLNNIRDFRESVHVLQLVIEEKYLTVKDVYVQAGDYYVLGIAFQMLGDTESALLAFLKSEEVLKTASRTPATKRRLLMDSL